MFVCTDEKWMLYIYYTHVPYICTGIRMCSFRTEDDKKKKTFNK